MGDTVVSGARASLSSCDAETPPVLTSSAVQCEDVGKLQHSSRTLQQAATQAPTVGSFIDSSNVYLLTRLINTYTAISLFRVGVGVSPNRPHWYMLCYKRTGGTLVIKLSLGQKHPNYGI